MHCSTSDYVTLITALPRGSWKLVCCISERWVQPGAFAAFSMCVCACASHPPPCSLHARPISPAPESLPGRKPNIRVLFLGQVQSETVWRSSGNAPGPVAMATAGLYLVQLFRCARFSVFWRGEEGRVRTVPTRARGKSGATSHTGVKQNPPARIMNSLACFSYLLLTLQTVIESAVLS